MHLLLRHTLSVDVALEEFGRRVSSLLGRQLGLNIFAVGKDHLGNAINVSCTILVVVERG